MKLSPQYVLPRVLVLSGAVALSAWGSSLAVPTGTVDEFLPEEIAASADRTTPHANHTPGQPTFERDVLPILSNRCYACHGPDAEARQAGLRLDTREGALALLESGPAIVSGDPAAGRLVARISSDREPMPPAPHERLSPQEVETLRSWIAAGAPWGVHWAFTPPVRPNLPAVRRGRWVRNPVDRFIAAGLEKAGLAPSPEADPATLIRRLSLDLTGLPPTPEEVDAFVQDRFPQAFERLVDRLLASPRSAEHFARHWLDLARYGDTHGTHLDNFREAWPYRDYVIRAFRENMPYDRFLTEQLAGDLVPNSGTQELVATTFLRNQVSTGDIDSLREAEARFAAVSGMAETSATVALGLTLNCARCHDHKYDPLTQRDYYRFYAYFNNQDGPPFDFGAAYPHPAVAVPTAEELLADYRLRLRETEIRAEVRRQLAEVPAETGNGPATGVAVESPADRVWVDDEPVRAEYTRFESPEEDVFFAAGPEHPVHGGKRSLAMRGGNQQLFRMLGFRPSLIVGEGDVLFVHLWIDPAKPPREILVEWFAGDWEHRVFWGEDLAYQGKLGTESRLHMGPVPAAGKWIRLEIPAADVGLEPGTEVTGIGLRQFQGSVYFDSMGSRTAVPAADRDYARFEDWLAAQRLQHGRHLPAELREAALAPSAKMPAEQRKALRDHYLTHACTETRPRFRPLVAETDRIREELADLHHRMSRTPIFREAAQRRETYLHVRGDWDKPAEPVERGIPGFLPPLQEGASDDRLGLARWLTGPDHPLTARVAVNRFWQQIFGAGLVRTPDDFGLRAPPPTHPELLDWLAVEFRESGWDIKRLIRLYVTSATYRQSAVLTPVGAERDRENRLLGRSSRGRLDAETLRDQALALGGLLVERVGGPSVKPPQPPGVWEAVATRNSNTKVFKADVEHDKVHRRSLYTFWKRTAHPPQMSLLDAPSRETCTCKRERTNTPLQALLLLNDAQFFDAARGLAERARTEAGETDPLVFVFFAATARRPSAGELAELTAVHAAQREHFAAHPDEAARLLPNVSNPTAARAALTLTAHLVLNLDEVLNRP